MTGRGFVEFFRKQYRGFIVACFIVFTGSSCAVTPPVSVETPFYQTVQVTQEVTQLVTRVVEIPVTATPSVVPVNDLAFTPTATITNIPIINPSFEPPLITIMQYSDCLYGPASFFLYKTSLPVDHLMEVTGRSPDGTWISVEEVHGWDPCWIPAGQAHLNTGSIDTIPVVYPSLPVSYWYKPPNSSAHREGSEVTVSWQAIGMAEYDYRGYLIIAWVCQGGVHVFLPVSIIPPYVENTGILSVKIVDEAGCSEVSSVNIYTAEKRGYSGEKVFWPAYRPPEFPR
jgi:hypothetical protein